MRRQWPKPKLPTFRRSINIDATHKQNIMHNIKVNFVHLVTLTFSILFILSHWVLIIIILADSTSANNVLNVFRPK